MPRNVPMYYTVLSTAHDRRSACARPCRVDACASMMGSPPVRSADARFMTVPSEHLGLVRTRRMVA